MRGFLFLAELSLESWKTLFSVSLQWISAVHNVLLSDWFINRWAASLKGSYVEQLIFPWSWEIKEMFYENIQHCDFQNSKLPPQWKKIIHFILIIYEHPHLQVNNAYKAFRIDAFPWRIRQYYKRSTFWRETFQLWTVFWTCHNVSHFVCKKWFISNTQHGRLS